MTAYSKTYKFEAVFAEVDESGNFRKETIEIPLITSEEFFSIFEDEAVRTMDNSQFGKYIVERWFPGLLAQLRPQSALSLIKTIFEHEKETFVPGETGEPTATE